MSILLLRASALLHYFSLLSLPHLLALGGFANAEANIAFGIGLAVWGISDAKAKKIVARPLAFPPVN